MYDQLTHEWTLENNVLQLYSFIMYKFSLKGNIKVVKSTKIWSEIKKILNMCYNQMGKFFKFFLTFSKEHCVLVDQRSALNQCVKVMWWKQDGMLLRYMWLITQIILNNNQELKNKLKGHKQLKKKQCLDENCKNILLWKEQLCSLYS